MKRTRFFAARPRLLSAMTEKNSFKFSISTSLNKK